MANPDALRIRADHALENIDAFRRLLAVDRQRFDDYDDVDFDSLLKRLSQRLQFDAELIQDLMLTIEGRR